jgi:nucleolar protein 56
VRHRLCERWAQVEERLRFFDEGIAPRKNATVMAEAMAQFKGGAGDEDMADEDEAADEMLEEGEKRKKKKKSKSLGKVRMQP